MELNILINKSKLEKRIDEMARQIEKDYEGKEIVLIENGRFTLPGTEILNEPLDK